MYCVSSERKITFYALLKNPTGSAVNISSGGAQGELSRCQQMLCAVLFITYPSEKGLYHYTLSNGRQQLEAATSQLPWCSSYRWYLDPFTKPQTRTPHISRIKTAAYFRCCVCAPVCHVGVMKASRLTSPLFLPLEDLRLCGYSSECYAC